MTIHQNAFSLVSCATSRNDVSIQQNNIYKKNSQFLRIIFPTPPPPIPSLIAAETRSKIRTAKSIVCKIRLF